MGWPRGGLRVLITGCGNIAGGFDQGRGPDEPPLTHVGAYRRDGRFNVVACVEPDDGRRASFMEAWQIDAGYRSAAEALDAIGVIDVVSVCSSTHAHAEDLDTILGASPRLVFCEKPVTPLAADTERLEGAYAERSIPLAVNYSRRWDPCVLNVKAEMAAGTWGELRSVVAVYNKGLLNNGSHMFDLLGLLFGIVRVVSVGSPVIDFFADDPSVPAVLESADGVPIQLLCANATDYAHFELQLILSKGVLTMEDGGLFWRERRVHPSPLFNGYNTLDGGVRRPGGIRHAMLRAVDNVHDAIVRAVPLASTIHTALVAQRLCEEVLSR